MIEKDFESNIVNFLKNNKNKKFTLGLSGGVDSVVLFNIMVRHNINFNAVYVHHGLSENADYWLTFCEELCYSYNIDFISKKVNVIHKNRKSLENEARILRYNIYKEVSDKYETDIILGHHHDDLVEAMLINLFNRSGIKGLGAMPNSYFNEDFKFNILRPFLASENFIISKDDIEKYAIENSINFIFDESNEDNSFSRNFLRNEIIPNLKSHFGNISKPMARTNREAQFIYSQEKNDFILEQVKENLELYKFNSDFLKNEESSNIKNIIYSFKKIGMKKSVSRGFCSNILSIIKRNKISNTMNMNIHGFLIFAHNNEVFIAPEKELLNFENLKNKGFINKSETEKSNISVGRYFKKNDLLRKNMPIVFREQSIYKTIDGELTSIYNYDLKNKNKVLKNNGLFKNQYLNYFTQYAFK